MNTERSDLGENEGHDPVTRDIVGAAFEVYRVLGYGFLEKVYQRAMQVELKLRGRNVELEHRIPVQYKGEGVGDYAADLFVENQVLVELKVASEYQTADEAQLLNELKATDSKWDCSSILAEPKLSSGEWSIRKSVFICVYLWL